ncbi:phosphoglucosamine mutase [candidate division KSB3 bacterium]|uniref:Phosphoglucosamine mutase n=1 Tax=candidate division KSB3 bacterium TaxID=2044937 RepID=A0A2G6E5B5_9BACT|nr:MAG: phosphoglucosamine mutase [candidate division KSB3 bacterium]PIE29842.1 MAG: phosphoglucosamine mutase [candidate division KSB3 bacterium]
METLFGTDGIRGVANRYPMTPEVMIKLGRAIGTLLGTRANNVVIGRDSRLSGQMLENALSAGLVASGIDVWLAGVIPTPAVASLTRYQKAQTGIVISASHNPAKDNGIKVFSHDGFKIPEELERRIEEIIQSDRTNQEQAIGRKLGRIRTLHQAEALYAEHIVRSIFFDGVPTLSGMKLVIDCANGAASQVAPSVLNGLQADVIELSVAPDGLNINENCGAMHTETLQQRVIEEKADLGVALDGDADRLVLIDEHGQQVDGDHILAMLALDLLQRGRLKKHILVATVMSNLGLELAMKNAGIRLYRSAVGDRHVVEKMRRLGSNLGGEQSGHVVMMDHGTTGDGLVTALAILKMLYTSQKPLSELAACMTTFPQTLVNVPIQQRKPIEEMVGVSEAIRRAEKELGERGRTLVRYSGTELLARVMVEAEDEADVSRIADMIVEEFHKENQQDTPQVTSQR